MIGEPLGSKTVPNATAVLVLGIISIPTCFCYGIVGLTCGIIALVLASKGFSAYNANPELYTQGSHSNLKAGKICAIIGTSLSGLYVLALLISLLIVGAGTLSLVELMEQLNNAQQ